MSKKKRHIMFYISTLRRGGAERVIVNLAEGFLKSGYQVGIVTPYQKPSELEFAISPEIKRIISEPSKEQLGSNRIANFKLRLKNLENIWKENQPDVIVSFVGKNNMMALMSARRFSIPVVISVRGNPESEYASKMMRLAMNALFPRAAGIVLQTRQAKAYFKQKIQRKSVILPNPLNPQFIREDFQGERKKEIVSVATLDENKNLVMLVRAFAKIAKNFPDWKVTIYGEGPERTHIEDTARELNISEQVFLPGENKQIADTIQQSSIYVMTSYTEGSPNALIEAMTLGLSCISTDCPCGGPAELIREGENGFLVPVDDDELLAEYLEQLIKDAKLREKLGMQASKIKEELEPSKVFSMWKNYIEQFIED